jgi:arylsulfatase A-like enzyme
MKFTDFLPGLSLAFILWTIPGVFLALILWLVIYGILRILPQPLRIIQFEHIMVWILFCLAVYKIKRAFFAGISLKTLTGLSQNALLIIGSLMALIIILLTRRYAEKILNEINSRITPVVWLFAALFILAVPLSLLQSNQSDETDEISVTSDESGMVSPKPQVIEDGVSRPNIILVTMDALTARDMQIYGYDRQTTPFLTKWAKDAIIFNRTYSSSNWTTPGAMSMMSGQRPWTHKIWYHAAYFPVKKYKNNLPGILKKHGYNTYGFVQNIFAHPETLGIKNAFLIKDKAHTFTVSSIWWFDALVDNFVDRPVVKVWIFHQNPVAKLIRNIQPPLQSTVVPPALVYNRFLEYIKENPDGPYFAWLHVYPPHDPYLPPEPFKGAFGDAGKFNTFEEQSRYFNEYKPQDQDKVDIIRKRYDEFILYSDKQFETFMSQLAESIDLSNTIIIFSSDHGESFSHGYSNHAGPHLYEAFVHIPLIIQLPGDTTGNIVKIPVEQTDIPQVSRCLIGWRGGLCFH